MKEHQPELSLCAGVCIHKHDLLTVCCAVLCCADCADDFEVAVCLSCLHARVRVCGVGVRHTQLLPSPFFGHSQCLSASCCCAVCCIGRACVQQFCVELCVCTTSTLLTTP